MKEVIKVRQFTGELVEFDQSKLLRSLKNAKADDQLADQIVKNVVADLYPGMSTKEIYTKAFKQLKSKRRPSAARYRLKRAIMDLGPSGFPFENYIGHIFRHDGYTADVGVVMEGNCVTHEVDVLGVVMNGPVNESNRSAIEHYGKTDVLAELEDLPALNNEEVRKAFGRFSQKHLR